MPRAVIGQFEEALVRSLDTVQLARAFRAAAQGFFCEIGKVDPQLAKRLEPILASLIAAA